MCRTTRTARSTRSSLESFALILLASFPIAMSQTSELCKLIAIASSASDCCKCLASRITILPYCLPLLQLHPRISLLTGSESGPLKRPHPFLSQKTFPNTSSVGDKRVSVEGLLSLTHTPSASIKMPTLRVHPLQPISWPVRRKPLRSLSLKRLPSLRERPQALRVTPSNLHQGHLRLNPEKIQVKSIAGRVDKGVITLEIALATPRESHSCPETSHFDRS